MHPLQTERLLVEIEDMRIVARDHQAEVGVLTGTQQARVIDLPISRAFVAEAFKEDLAILPL